MVSPNKDRPELSTPQLMTSAEVARAWRIDPKSVIRWEKNGSLLATFTPGGHRRYYAAQILAMLTPTKDNVAAWEAVRAQLPAPAPQEQAPQEQAA